MTPGKHGIVTAGGGHGWETSIVAALADPATPLTVAGRCADMADVLASAATGRISACLLAADLRRLDSETVHQLAGLGVSVVAVHAVEDIARATALERIGVFDVVADDVSPAVMIASLRRAVRHDDDAARDPGDDADLLAGDPGRALRSSRVGLGKQNGAPGGGDGAQDRDAGAPGDDRGVDGGGRAESLASDNGTSAAGASRSDEREPGDSGYDDPDERSRRRRRRHRAHARFGRNAERDQASKRGRASHVLTDPAGAWAQESSSGATNDSMSASVSPEDDGGVSRDGRIIAVWGPKGAPGRTTVAMGLADRAAVADPDASVMLIDADAYGGVIASAWGLLDDSAGLAGACRLAAGGRLDAGSLAELCWAIDGQRTLLTGISRADRWPELRPSAIPAVLELARQRASLVIVDVAALLERDEEITFDTLAPRRNGATLAVLEAADEILAVGSADPLGTERLARGLAELTEAVDGTEARIVFNRVRPTAASKAELTEAAVRYCGSGPVAFLPDDRAACDKAWQRGLMLSEVAPKSALTQAFGELAETVCRPSSIAGQPLPSAR